MKQSLLTKAATLLLAVSLCPNKSQAVTSIVGDTVEIWGTAQSNGSETLRDTVVVTDPGIEFTASVGNTDVYTLDFDALSIRLVTLNQWFSPWFGGGNPPSGLEFRGINVPGQPELIIGSVDVRFSDSIVPEDNAPFGYPDFSENNVTFGDDFVRLEYGPYSFPLASTVDITMNFIPEPATGLLTFGACGIFMLRRRRGSFSI